VADDDGFAVVAPNGTGNMLLEDVRTWNAGGGQNGWQCVSSDGCESAVDELAYFDALHDELMRAVDIDESRIFVTGHSNGGAMAHRLICERSMRFAAAVSVAGGNQVAQVQGCTPARPMSVMEIHGTDDPCWSYQTSTDACVNNDGMKKVGVKETIDTWRALSGCTAEPTRSAIDDKDANDDTDAEEIRHACIDGAEVVEVKVNGGGHSWPGGDGFGDVGNTSRDFSASKMAWQFFKRHPLPSAPSSE
jgi:polyhydroxybutyrate depolymerase